MARMKPVKVPEELAPVLSPEIITKLLKACSGASFEDGRDTAVARLFLDTGVRRSELANLTLQGVDLDGAHRHGQGAPAADGPLRQEGGTGPWRGT